MKGICLLVAVSAIACETEEQAALRKMREEWEAPCLDKTVLVATTAGSPNFATCTNKFHRMLVETASEPSKEEFAAVVFCRCERGDESDYAISKQEKKNDAQ